MMPHSSPSGHLWDCRLSGGKAGKLAAQPPPLPNCLQPTANIIAPALRGSRGGSSYKLSGYSLSTSLR